MIPVKIPDPHPIISPEYFKITPQLYTKSVKALFVSYLKNNSPQIITDESDNILNTFLSNSRIPIFFHPHVVMYVDPYIQLSSSEDNYVATTYYRNYYSTTVGTYPMDTIKGNVLFFGTTNLLTKKQDDNDHSVPYSTVEELLNIYETQT